jgi:hypothetical protein
MARFKDLIPSKAYKRMVDHLLERCGLSIVGSWRRSRADEDSVTGDFWGQISTNGDVSEGDGLNWNIEYKRVGGRGAGAFEKLTGADGIYELAVRDSLGKVIFQKEFLFQAKKGNTLNTKKARDQAMSMENIAPGGSLMIVYEKGDYRCMHADRFLQTDERPTESICDYIVNDFFECLHGTEGMKFEIDTRSLVVNDNEIYAPDINFVIRQNVRIRR